MRLHLIGVVTCLVVSSSASPVLAQDAPVTDDPVVAPTPEPDPERDDTARRHFEWGRAAYDRGEFDQAITEFLEAHRLSGRTDLFYNLYLAHRDARHDREAAEALRSYLAGATTEIANRAQLEARLQRLDEALARAEPPPPEEPDEQIVEPQPGPAPSPPPPASPDHTLGTVGWILVGVGGAAVIAGAITGGLAIGATGELAGMCTGTACPGAARATYDRADTLANVTNVLLPVGGVIAAVGLVLAILDLTSGSPDAPSAAAACTSDGCIGSVRGSF